MKLHETHISKTRKIVGYIVSILPSGMILMAGIMKVFNTEEMQANLSETPHLSGIVFCIGLIELLCLALYWIPATSNLGFILLCSFTGGIIVAEIVSGQVPIMGIIISSMFYVGTFLRKPSILKNR